MKNFISYLHCRLKTETDEKLRTGIKAILTENTKLYKQEILEFKKEENNKQITNADNKSKETWKILKKEYQEENLPTETLKIKYNEQYVFDTKKQCEIFNNYFATVAQEITKNSKRSKPIDIDPNLNSIFLTPTTKAEMKNIVQNLKTKTSYGYDKFSNKFVKENIEFLLDPLVYLFNLSITTGTFPDQLKLTKIIPIFKKGKTDDIKNYRPIAIISPFSKIFEKLMCNRLLKFLNNNDILHPNQYGFLKNKCTTDAAHNLIQQILHNHDANKMTLSTFYDLSKAFDCVDINMLLNDLENYGIRGTALEWWKSYLCNRKQYVELKTIENQLIKSEKSSQVVTKFGVPQGSVAGPILYLIYINSVLNNSNQTAKTLMYADDTTSIVSSSNVEEIEIISQEAIATFVQNIESKNLVINEGKTNYMIFNFKKKINFEPYLSIADIEIERVKSTKFLGFMIDDQLSWTEHVNYISRKINSGLYVLRRITKLCDLNCSKMIYFSLIYSHITYGILLWGNSSQQNLNKILLLQKRAIRYMCNLDYSSSCKGNFRELHLLTAPSLFVYYSILYIYQHKNNLTKLGESHDHNTRHRNTLAFPRHNTTKFEKQVIYNGLKLYNKLPIHIREIKEIKKFKHSLKKFLIDKCLYNLDEL